MVGVAWCRLGHEAGGGGGGVTGRGPGQADTPLPRHVLGGAAVQSFPPRQGGRTSRKGGRTSPKAWGSEGVAPQRLGMGVEGQECAEGRFCRALRPTRVPSRARTPARLGRGPGVRRKTARPALFLWWGRSAWCVQAERGGAPRRGGGSMRKKRKPALRVTAERGGGSAVLRAVRRGNGRSGDFYGRRKIRSRPSSKSRKAGPYTAPDGDGQRPVDSTRRFRVCLLSKFPKRGEKTMGKSGGGKGGGGGKGSSKGGNWPSTTGNPSGGGRGNAPAKGS